MEIKLIDNKGKAAKAGVKVSDAAFGREFNEALVHQVVVAYMANARTSTRAQKHVVPLTIRLKNLTAKKERVMHVLV